MASSATGSLRAYKEASAVVRAFGKYLDNPKNPAADDWFVPSSQNMWDGILSHFPNPQLHTDFLWACVPFVDAWHPTTQAAANHRARTCSSLVTILHWHICKPYLRAYAPVYRRIKAYLGPGVLDIFMQSHREYLDNPDSMSSPEAFAAVATSWLGDDLVLLAAFKDPLGLEEIIAAADILQPSFFDNLLAQDYEFAFQPDVPFTAPMSHPTVDDIIGEDLARVHNDRTDLSNWIDFLN